MGDWTTGMLQGALDKWNDSLTIMWSLLTQSPQEFRGGVLWAKITTINGALQALGYGLIVLFFAISFFKSATSFKDFQRPEYAIRSFLFFGLTKAAVTYGMDIMANIYTVCGGIVSAAAGSMGDVEGLAAALPQATEDAIRAVDFLSRIPLFCLALVLGLVIWALSFVILLTVYGRFFRLYMHTALAPIALSSFAGEATSFFGKSFLRSYINVCLEGAIIIMACILFSAFSAEPPSVDATASAFDQVMSYMGQTIFNMLILVTMVKTADTIAQKMFGV